MHQLIDVFQLLQRLPLERVDAANLSDVFAMVNVIREAGDIEESAAIYRRLDGHDGEAGERARLWYAYCRVRIGELDTMHSFPNTLGELEPQHDLFPLRQLVLGLYHMRRDEDFAFVSAWEHKGAPGDAELHKEELIFENVELKTRSYK